MSWPRMWMAAGETTAELLGVNPYPLKKRKEK
jgi:hypothetical protein